MLVTDSTILEAGAKDFVFVCKKQPFAITCSPSLPKTIETYVDLDVVLRLNIPMKNLQCTRLTNTTERRYLIKTHSFDVA